MAKGKAASSTTSRRTGAKPAAAAKSTTSKPSKPLSSSSSSKPSHHRPDASSSIPVVARAVGVEDDKHSTRISFETKREWDTVCRKLEKAVRDVARKAVEEEGAGVDEETKKEVERLMVQTFLGRTLDMMRQNVIIDGHLPPRPTSSSTTSSSSTDPKAYQPFDERLNQKVMSRQLDLMDASHRNGRKRRVMPRTVVEMLRGAVERESAKVQGLAGEGTWREGEVKLVNAGIQDAKAAEAEYAKAADTFDELLKYVPDEITRAERAAEVQLEVAKQIAA